MNETDRAQALQQMMQSVNKRMFNDLPLPMEETLAAFMRLDEQLTSDENELDEDDLFESILFELEREWGLSEASSLQVAQALDEYMRVRNELWDD